ncbi:MAG: antitoxin VapB family protein [Candidatus Aenigmarchaeota archaeon]|nr:antitoxin VapB family protein [Candidatus Aenigmarchaeota archaeon]
MAVKTITITKDAYNVLRGMKMEKESFSDVINRIALEKKSVKDFLGILKDIDAEALQKRAREIRKSVSGSFERRHDRLRHISRH